jgi:lipooligosaccharide transport system permease protein
MSERDWHPSLRFMAVWQRNFLVWRKLALTSLLGNLADPMIYMLGLGYGLGSLVGEVQGVSYISFLVGGTICYSTMNSASFEALYSGFSRMHTQKTWESIMFTPLHLYDVVIAEWVWAACKSLLSGGAILLVAALLGVIHGAALLWILPIAFLIGLCFSALGLVITAIAPSYDFFMYYFTLFVTPMALGCGVFFPVEQLPAALRDAADLLPLSHAVALVRPLSLRQVPADIVLHLLVLFGYTAVGVVLSCRLFRRRLLR